MNDINALEKLNILEGKIVKLIELLKQEKELCSQLAQENEELKAKAEVIENSLLSNKQNFDEINQERALTKMMVDDLIGSIDRLIEVKQE